MKGKASRLSAFLALTALVLPAGVFASDMNKKTLHLYENATLQGKQLTPGDYRVEWNGSGPDVQVSILRGKDTIATVPAKIATEGSANQQTGYSLTPENGTQELTEIFFSGEKYNLELQPNAQSSAGNGSPSGR